MHGCAELLSYLRSRSEALSILRPWGSGDEQKLPEEHWIGSAQKLILNERKNVHQNLRRALFAPESNLSGSLRLKIRAALISSGRHVVRDPSARYTTPLFAEAAESLSWEEVYQCHNDGFPSLGDQICRDLALHHHAAVRRKPQDKFTMMRKAYSSMSRRMLEVWQDLDPSEELKAADESREHQRGHVFSDLILIIMDKLTWLVGHHHAPGDGFESATDFFKRTPLHLACEDAHSDSFDHFDSCSPSFFEARDKFMMTAVHVAALSGNGAAIVKLQSLKADLTLLDIWGRSPLMLASAKGHAHVVELLLKYHCEIDAIGVNQSRALVCAIRAGMEKTVYLLLKRGANLFTIPTKNYLWRKPINTDSISWQR